MLTKAGKKDEEGEAVVFLKQRDHLRENRTLCIEDFFFLINPLVVTICPETFSNLCVDSITDM